MTCPRGPFEPRQPAAHPSQDRTSHTGISIYICICICICIYYVYVYIYNVYVYICVHKVNLVEAQETACCSGPLDCVRQITFSLLRTAWYQSQSCECWSLKPRLGFTVIRTPHLNSIILHMVADSLLNPPFGLHPSQGAAYH
jgi:hypothetical protein